MAQLKADISDFQANFLSSDPYSNNVHENWEKFKQAIINAIAKNIPQTMSRVTKELPWITHNVKRQMKQQKSYTTRQSVYRQKKHSRTTAT